MDLAPRRFPILAATLVLLLVTHNPGCRQDSARPSAANAQVTQSDNYTIPPVNRLVFRAQELPFRYERGETGKAWPVETTGGGVGLLDYDGDGRLDLFFAQGGPLLPSKTSSAWTTSC